jgi:hypothetical protein
MKAWALKAILLVAGVLVVEAASAEHTKAVPVVTQVQGATFYRTSITISNANATVTTAVTMTFSYRSPADGTFQIANVNLSPNLGPKRVQFFDDIIQGFKDAGAIRTADRDKGLFGTLLVTFHQIDEDLRYEAAVVARTYSPADGGGTLGIAYAGRCVCLTGSKFRVISSSRTGIFGNDGSTRSNIGIINEGFGPTDVDVKYFDGETGQLLKQFNLSEKAGHVLQENEVFQINKVFDDSAIPPTTHTLVIELDSTVTDVYVSGYGVQLDNTTNDGAFYFFEEP